MPLGDVQKSQAVQFEDELDQASKYRYFRQLFLIRIFEARLISLESRLFGPLEIALSL